MSTSPPAAGLSSTLVADSARSCSHAESPSCFGRRIVAAVADASVAAATARQLVCGRRDDSWTAAANDSLAVVALRRFAAEG